MENSSRLDQPLAPSSKRTFTRRTAPACFPVWHIHTPRTTGIPTRIDMEWLFEPFRHEFMQRALVGGGLIGFTAGFLGAFVVLRRLALMADSLSHSLLPGLALGVMIFGLAPIGLFFGALVAALFVALGATLISRSSR